MKGLRSITYAAVAMLIAYAVLIPVTYGIAPVSPRGIEQLQEKAMLQSWVEAIPLLPARTTMMLQRYVSGQSLLADRSYRTAAFLLPVIVATLGALLVLWRIHTANRDRDRHLSDQLFRWAVAFACLHVFMYPMTTQDMWLSVAWGRMIVDGINPYYAFMPADAIAGLPLQIGDERMTYGPLWACVSAVIAFLGARNTVIEFLLSKLLLVAAWLVTLVLLRKLVREVAPAKEPFAVWIMGWTPLALHTGVGEGHNDVVVAMLIVTWLLLIARRKEFSTAQALAASALVKYVTAPLVLVELLRAALQRTLWTRRYVLSLVVTGAAMVLFFSLFARDQHMFDPLLRMRDWEFWTPATALMHSFSRFGVAIPEDIAAWAVLVICAGIAVHSMVAYRRQPTLETLSGVALAVLVTILFCTLGHVWPWFVVWVLPLCVLAARPGLVTFLLALIVQAPFLHLDWIFGGGRTDRETAGIVLYGVATAAALTMLFIAGREQAAAARRNWRNATLPRSSVVDGDPVQQTSSRITEAANAKQRS